MKKEQRFIPVPVEFRHHDISNYLGKGIKDPVELSNWTDDITDKMDRWNEEGEHYEGETEDLLNNVLQFSNAALRAVRYAMHKDRNYIAKLNGRIKELERQIQYEPKPEKPVSVKPSDAERKEVERLASLIK